MRRWYLVALLLILAAGLVVSLLRYAENRITTHSDGTVSRVIPGAPIVETYWRVEDFSEMCIQGHRCGTAMATVRGIFPRSGVPFPVALFAGFILPQLLLVSAVAVAIRRRWAIAVALAIAAILLSLNLVDRGPRRYSRISTTTVQQHIVAETIIAVKTEPCEWAPDYCTDVSGLLARRGVARPLTIALGLVLPGLLFLGSVIVAFRPKTRKTPP